MANPVLPAGLRQLASTFQIGSPAGVMRTAVAGGRPRYALDYDRGVQQFQVSFLMDRSKLLVWTVFFHRVIRKGSVQFEMELDSGAGFATHVVNIVPGSYSAVRAGGPFTSVSFVVEGVSSVYDISDEDVQTILELNDQVPASLDGLVNRLAVFANVDLTRAFGED